MNRIEFLKKLHTVKSVMIQQYQPVYPAVYSIIIDQKSLDNVAHVLYQNGHGLALQGKKYGIDFRNAELPELKRAVGKILSAMETGQQENLWHKVGLDAYQRLFPKQGSQLPYFDLCKNNYGTFAYTPLSDEKFAFLVPDSYGQFKMEPDHRYFGAYDSNLESTLDESYHLDNIKIAVALCDYEPAIVWKYEESRILEKLDRMTRETNARPFIFPQPGGEPIISLPEETKDYLLPTEIALAEKLVVLQESVNDDSVQTGTEESTFQLMDNTPEGEAPTDEAGLQMTL